jgi:TRAP-type C4-dicarboxylate transport system permease small subunit
MYGLFVMMGILTWGVFTNVVLKSPAIWIMEMAQFSMAAYYLLGGGYTMQQEAHVRMDVVYDRFSPRFKAIADLSTGVILLFYLGILVWGGISSTAYAFEFDQKNFTAWRPPLAPIKTIMTVGMALMLAQAISLLFKDFARVLGRNTVHFGPAKS